MRKPALAGLAFLAACYGSTPAGPIGQELDLRAYLPDSLRSLASTQADTTFRRQIKVGPDSVPVEISWTSFHHGPGRFLGVVNGKLLRPARYDSLRFGNPSNLGNDGTKDTINATATVQVDWFRRVLLFNRHGSASFRFNARGQ